ncbi:hypothetical protein Maes01_02677 [Microbulbifer aestuariivivens]|uniref:CPXCG motif-containing cysteine-rich protein n=1 Tax=Microbulbifer aestuariivivens TaxID=1908308 RepID=A0ABP9WSB0_9GAMM
MTGLEEYRGHCPYCGEPITLLVDTSPCSQGGYDSYRYIEDCQVCCRPIAVTVAMEEDGSLRVSLQDENSAI